MKYNAKKEWSKEIQGRVMMYPAEYVIRIFKGSYHRLNFDKDSFKNKKICDAGCGDGRHLVLLKQCGFDIYGTEITEDIVNKVMSNLHDINIDADIRVGTNDKIPFEDEYFDYLLSWNACYYMGDHYDFDKHVEEYARILKKEGYLVLSIPKKTAFIFKDSEKLKKGYVIIRDDPFKIRNGEVERIFEDEKEIEATFQPYFKNFIFSSVVDDCFGWNYHFHIVVCQKK